MLNEKWTITNHCYGIILSFFRFFFLINVKTIMMMMMMKGCDHTHTLGNIMWEWKKKGELEDDDNQWYWALFIHWLFFIWSLIIVFCCRFCSKDHCLYKTNDIRFQWNEIFYGKKNGRIRNKDNDNNSTNEEKKYRQ